jgi:hypothetical protein
MMQLFRSKCLNALGGLALVVTTSGCMDGGGIGNPLTAITGEDPSTPEVAAFLDHDVDYALGATIVEGAVVGAVAVGGLCLLLGRSAKECAIAAAGGAVVGGAAGVAVAEGNRQQEVYKKEQNDLAEQLANERKGLNERGVKLAAAVSSLRRKAKDIKRQYKRNEISLEQYRVQAVRLQNDAKRMNAKNDDELADLDEREAEIKEMKLTKRNSRSFKKNAQILLRHDRDVEELQNELSDIAIPASS